MKLDETKGQRSLDCEVLKGATVKITLAVATNCANDKIEGSCSNFTANFLVFFHILGSTNLGQHYLRLGMDSYRWFVKSNNTKRTRLDAMTVMN